MEAAITPNTAAIMLEPIQGEAGVIVPPAGYLKQVSELCKKHNVLFVADEIQVGLGRTGRMFACQHEGVRPDVVILGKALGGGFYPVAAVLADQPIMGLFQPGEHGSTFGETPWQPPSDAFHWKCCKMKSWWKMPPKWANISMDQLAEIPSKHVKEVRGKGLLIGVELKDEAKGARRFCEALQSEGILCKETHENVIRFAPPLVIDKETIDWALERIRKVLLMG